MSEQFEDFRGTVGLTVDESEPWWPLLPEHEHGPRPNVLIVLFDDMGFAHLNCYGSTIDTPNINRLAAEGLRYSNFHVTPLCSPTRASLMTGRNHHAVGMRTIANYHDTGFTNMRASVSKHSAAEAERLEAWQSRLDDIGGPRSWTDVPWGWAQVANTPLRWYKSDAYGGGVRVPLIVRWPERVPQGQIRDQFHYVTDIVPTVLDVLGESAPETYKGLAQMPVHGKSMAYTFDEPDAGSNKGVQYFEMRGHRAIWMDGWKAVTRHFRGTPYDEDRWELFNLEEDFSEVHDLAEREPERLQRMIDRWWVEAGRYNVLPLDDRIPAGGPSQRPGNPHDGLHYRYYPPTAHLHGRVSPMLQLGDWTITAEVERASADDDGVLFAQGSMAGGVSFYIQNNRLCLDFNSREDVTVGRSDSEIPLGRSTLAAALSSGSDKTGVVTLSVDEAEVGRVEIPDTSGIAVRGGADVGADHYSPVTGSYEAPFEFSGTIRVVDVKIEPTVALPQAMSAAEASEAG